MAQATTIDAGQHSDIDRGGDHEQQQQDENKKHHEEGNTSPLEKESQAEVAKSRGEQPEMAEPDEGKGSSLTSVSLDAEDNCSSGGPTYATTFATCGGGSGSGGPDLELGLAGAQKPAAIKSLRYYIMLLALLSPFIVTYSKTIINFAIIDMIDPNYSSRNKSNNKVSQMIATDPGTSNQTIHQDYFDLDNSCPVSDEVRARLKRELAKDEKLAIETKGEKFQWDTDKQGYLKSAYSIGHMLLQVVGGRLSEIYGPQFIMSLSACLIALCCLSAPFLASIHYYLLFGDLFFLGILGSFMTPSLITLISNWLTPGEKSLTMSFYLVSSRLGYAFSSLLCGLLIDAQLSWRYLFYSAGWISLVFGNLFFVCSRNQPHEHPLISQAELKYLASKNKLVREAMARRQADKLEQTELQTVVTSKGTGTGSANEDEHQTNDQNNSINKSTKQQHAKGRPAAPWRAILTNPPVWAFIVTKFCVKLMGDTVQIELPSYLKRVMHMESKYNGYINSANYVIFCISCVAVGTLAKWANKKRPFGWTKTTVRKVFQCTASFGVSLVLFGVAMSVCDEYTTLGLFMAMFFVTTFSTGGEAQLPLDLSERYAGTIHALGGTLAISGIIEPIMVGQFLLGHSADRSRWKNIWLGASAISFLGGLIFLLLGDAKIQPFDEIDAPGESGGSDKNKPAAKRNETTPNGHQQQEQQHHAGANSDGATKTVAVVEPTAPEEPATPS